MLKVAGRANVPADATSVVVNITAVGPGARGYVTAYPCGAERPNTSALNYAADVTGANEIITDLSADGELCLFTDQATDLVVDVVGYTK